MNGEPAHGLVAQLGARMHYAVPRMLHEAGRLERVFVDICASAGWPALLPRVPGPVLPTTLRRLRARTLTGVPRERITAFTAFGWQYACRRAAAGATARQLAVHLWAGETFARLVVRRDWGGARFAYAFHGAALEIHRAAAERGLLSVLEQAIVPRRVETGLLDAERRAFPLWEGPPLATEHEARFQAREAAEWRQADVIVCPSESVRDGIAACGGPAERCAVVPYGLDPLPAPPPRRPPAGPLRVLTIGAVCLRKGAPYALEAARRLGRAAVFRMVGPVAVSPAAQRELRTHVELVAPVPRPAVGAHYRWADVFLLPSLCEGSATVTYEALRAGLPVVCTAEAGSVVRDGVEGFIVPARSAGAIVAALERLAADPDRLCRMAAAAAARFAEFTLREYRRRLLDAIARDARGGERPC